MPEIEFYNKTLIPKAAIIRQANIPTVIQSIASHPKGNLLLPDFAKKAYTWEDPTNAAVLFTAFDLIQIDLNQKERKSLEQNESYNPKGGAFTVRHGVEYKGDDYACVVGTNPTFMGLMDEWYFATLTAQPYDKNANALFRILTPERFKISSETLGFANPGEAYRWYTNQARVVFAAINKYFDCDIDLYTLIPPPKSE